MSEQHTDPNAAYDAEVRRIAEILAMAEYKKVKYTLISWEYLSEAALVDNYDFTGCDYRKQKSVLIDNKMEEAREMVAEMAGAFVAAYMIADPAYATTDHVGFYNDIGEYKEGNILNYLLIERGLIPATENKQI